MKRSFVKSLALSAIVALGATAVAPLSANAQMMAGDEETVMVGGAAMFPSKNIIENAVNSDDHTTLVAAVKAAGLVDALSGPGPFTVFAPVNRAFGALPAGTVDTLLMPENKDQLTKILTAHVVSGALSSEDLMARAASGGALSTLSGDSLSVQESNGYVYVIDENGGAAKVTISDVNQSNGVIHVVDSVLLPK